MKLSAKARHTVLLVGIGTLILFAGTDVGVHAARLHFNDSNSVPVGLYQETPDRSGAYAAICLPLSTLRSAQDAGLTLGPGSCPSGVAPILKILFEPSVQQPLTYSTEGFVFGDTSLPNTTPKPFSGSGKPLSHYPFGTYTSGFWAISSYNPDSFDSRYFGPVEPTAIRFYATPVLTR